MVTDKQVNEIVNQLESFLREHDDNLDDDFSSHLRDVIAKIKRIQTSGENAGASTTSETMGLTKESQAAQSAQQA